LSKTIAILGCGWLGLPLAKAFLTDGFQIHGSTTSEEKISDLERHGVIPFLISLSEDKIEGNIREFLTNAAVLIINVPPKLRGENSENYVKKMQLLHDALKKSSVRKVIFVSSTSVYGDVEGDVTEQTLPRPSTESGIQLLASEHIFKDDTEIQTTIIRFGGLIGQKRHPVTMLSKRKNLKNGNSPINLIHLKDCIKIISEIVQKNWWCETFNGVYPYHPTKQKYYTSEALRKGLLIPDYSYKDPKNGKIVHSYNLTNVKEFKFTTTL